jgi:(p)ppGpp synthase/HD superfamily hydrolase
VRVAQTNVQLYNQLRERGLPLDDLVLVHRAYEFLTTLYTGYFQADGKPFVSHGVGVASILAELGQPAEIVAAGMLHNVYGTGDFGDGERRARTPQRRRLVREAVGERVEDLVFRFADMRVHRNNIADVRARLRDMDASDRSLVVVELADHLEKYVDLAVLYLGDGSLLMQRTELLGPQLVEMAHELGEPKLAAMLSASFEEATAAAGTVPPGLRRSDGRRVLELVVPRSCERRAELRDGQAP